jgi:CheY-like chemotaxis protein
MSASAGASSSSRATGTFEALALPAPARASRILLADDSRTVREAVARMLTAAGYVVDLAADGWEAWEMLQEVKYDLLVTDLEMPRVGGFELIEKVRRSGAPFAMLPVVVISSQKGDAHRERADKAGASCFVPKPVARHALLERVAELLKT